MSQQKDNQSNNQQNQQNQKKKSFTDRDYDTIAKLMNRINDKVDVSWRYRDGEWDTELEITGLSDDGEPIIFTGGRTARAGLEMWLAGYDVGNSSNDSGNADSSWDDRNDGRRD